MGSGTVDDAVLVRRDGETGGKKKSTSGIFRSGDGDPCPFGNMRIWGINAGDRSSVTEITGAQPFMGSSKSAVLHSGKERIILLYVVQKKLWKKT